MLSIALKNTEIRGVIVALVAVDVVNNFGWQKPTPKDIFHYKAMLSDVSLVVRVRVIVTFHEDVAGLVNDPAAIPRTVMLWRPRAGVPRFDAVEIEGSAYATTAALRYLADLNYGAKFDFVHPSQVFL